MRGRSNCDLAIDECGRRRRRPPTLVLSIAVATAAVVGGSTSAPADGLYPLGETTGVPWLSDEPLPYKVVPERPPLPLELGCKFLGRGELPKAIELPTGAVWTPCLWVFGTFRSAFQTYESIGPPGRNTEWANRLDLFANLQLTSTEKCIIGVAPLDENRFTQFTRYSFESNQGLEGFRSEMGIFVRALFCEGDFGSLFPDLSLRDASFLSGWLLSAGVGLLAIYNLRKKFPFLPLIDASGWLQVHLLLGVFGRRSVPAAHFLPAAEWAVGDRFVGAVRDHGRQRRGRSRLVPHAAEPASAARREDHLRAHSPVSRPTSGRGRGACHAVGHGDLVEYDLAILRDPPSALFPWPAKLLCPRRRIQRGAKPIVPRDRVAQALSQRPRPGNPR